MIDWSKTIVVFDDETVDAVCGKEILWVRDNAGGGGGGGDAIWGFIRGDIDDQTDLMQLLNALSPYAPSDGHFYVQKDGNWEDLYFVEDETVTFYVDGTNGDDDNDGLTGQTAFATIQKAIESTPIAWSTTTIYVAAGTYTTSQDHLFTVDNKNIEFVIAGSVTISGSFNVWNRSTVEILASSAANYAFAITGGLFIQNGSSVNIGRNIGTVSIGKGSIDSNISLRSSQFHCSKPIAISTSANYLLSAYENSLASFTTQETGFSLLADDGSIIGYGGSRAATETTYRGGRIFYGEQQTSETSPVEVYVDPANGSDSNDGSQTDPFQTLQKAIDTVPEGTKSFSIIHMAAGTYTTAVSGTPFMVDNQCIIFSASGAVVFSAKMSIANYSDILFNGASGATLTINNTLEAETFSTVHNDINLSIDGSGGSGTALSLQTGARFIHDSDTKTIELIGLYCVRAKSGSIANFYALTTTLPTGYTGGCGISATQGAVVSYGTHTTTCTTPTNTGGGGRILAGAQPVFGTMASKDDAPNDGKEYVRKNQQWAEAAKPPTTGGATYYVNASSGSDNNDGSQYHPFATIGKAITEIDDGGGMEISTINIAAGTYAGFSIADRAVKFVLGGAVAVSSRCTIIDHSCVYISGSYSTSLSVTNGIAVQRGSYVLCESDLTLTNSGNVDDLLLIEDSQFLLPWNYLTATNNTQYGTGVHVYRGYIYLYSSTITATTGIQASHGGIAAYGTLTGTMSNKTYTSFGGRVYTGSDNSDDPAITFWVNGDTGSDSNAGTSSAPFKTLAKGLNSIGENAEGILVTAGTFTEALSISDRKKPLTIKTYNSTTINNLAGISVSNSKLNIEPYSSSTPQTLTIYGDISVNNKAEVLCTTGLSLIHSTSGSNLSVDSARFIFRSTQTLYISNSYTTDSSKGFGVSATNFGTVFIDNLLITANIGIRVQQGSVVSYSYLSTTSTFRTAESVAEGGGQIYAAASYAPFKVTGTASAGSSFTITDSRIDSDHWKIPEGGITFGTPSNVTSSGTWTTNVTNHTVTFTATFTGSTTVTADFYWFQ